LDGIETCINQVSDGREARKLVIVIKCVDQALYW
jgi:hypothetical protein